MSREQRSRLVIEPEIQYALIRQLCGQWFLHLVASLILLGMLQVLLGGYFRPWSEHWQQIWPTLASLTLAMLCLLPVYIRNSLKLSNRFVGPIHRFRSELRTIAGGKQYEPIHFRDADFWPALARELDEAMDALANRSGGANVGAGNVPGGGIVFPTGDSLNGGALDGDFPRPDHPAS